jgi:hypothetical protein
MANVGSRKNHPLSLYTGKNCPVNLPSNHASLGNYACALVYLFVLIALVLLLLKHLTLEEFTVGGYSLLFGALLFTLGTVATGLLQESKVIVSQDGLFIPIFPSASNHFERFIEWREIEKVILNGEH